MKWVSKLLNQKINPPSIYLILAPQKTATQNESTASSAKIHTAGDNFSTAQTAAPSPDQQGIPQQFVVFLLSSTVVTINNYGSNDH